MNTDFQISGQWNTPVESLGIGVFDGLHLGHQKIADLSTLLLTFYPHPDVILNKKKDIQWLTTAEELRAFKVPLATLAFNETVSRYPAHDFLEHAILKKFSPKRLVVGYDFVFGYKKSGNVAMLKSWASENGITVMEVPPVTQNRHIVSSSRIREQLQAGEFDAALQLLGHPYLVMGKVIHGEGRGRLLGFPTANLLIPPHKLLPAIGVYRATVERDAHSHLALAYVGRKPTFNGHELSLEVHLIDQKVELYDARLKVWLHEMIRPEVKFENAQALIAQLEKDRNLCRSRSHDNV